MEFLTELLTPLTHNEFVLKNSFDAVAKIHNIPPQLFDNGCIFASFDVTSLFTNVPLNRTVNIILDRVYNENLVMTNLRKRILKKLIKDILAVKQYSQQTRNYINRLMALVRVVPLDRYLLTL